MPKQANAWMWTALGSMYAFDGAPLFAALAFCILALTDGMIDEVR